MIIRIGVVGELPPRLHQTAAQLLEQLSSTLRQGDGSAQLRLVVSPDYTADGWRGILPAGGGGVSVVCRSGEACPWEADRRLSMDTSLRDALGETLCNQADLILAVWSEDVTERSGAAWEMLRLAHEKKVPCVWLSSKSGEVYWSRDSYYQPYTPQVLEELCRSLSTPPRRRVQAGAGRVPLLGLGSWLRGRFLGKFDTFSGQQEAERDSLLKDSFSPAPDDPVDRVMHGRILEAFRAFDQAAITLNGTYQALLYWRAILPFVTTIFLAVGFYAENVLGVWAMPGKFWVLVAGIGFLIHGLLNLYVYWLSKSGTIRDWHQGFLSNRYIAELLRVVIHFAPYGVQLDLRRLCGAQPDAYRAVRNVTDEPAEQDRRIDQRTLRTVLTHVEQMVSDQIAYHAASARRYGRIVEHLDTWGKYLFGVGFVVVVLRSVFQLAVAIHPLESGYVGAVALSKFSGSFANMLALLLPAWASYFSTKAAQCNFRYNRDNHQNMYERMTELLERIRDLKALGETLPLKAVHTLAEELAGAMLLEDTSAWQKKYTGSTITHL